MRLIIDETPHKIIAEEGKQIRSKDDIYIPAHYDEEGNFIEEYFPYYSTVIYVPNSITEEAMNNMYIEEQVD